MYICIELFFLTFMKRWIFIFALVVGLASCGEKQNSEAVRRAKFQTQILKETEADMLGNSIKLSIRGKDVRLFRGMEFYATLLHEMVHSTGTPERLNRNTGKRFGDNLYAKEELVAELGAARVGQELGFDKRILDNNAAYLDGWISSLKQEPKFILSLMGDVDKASRMILEKLAA